MKIFKELFMNFEKGKGGNILKTNTNTNELCPFKIREQFVFDNIVITCKMIYFRKKLVISMIW